MVHAVADIRNPCNCGSIRIPRQYQDETTSLDHIECRDCVETQSDTHYVATIEAWNAANTDHTWEEYL